MIIGIVSDTHFGFSRFEQDAHEQGKKAILESAKACDLLLLPGDIFDVRVPKPETLAQVSKMLRQAGRIMAAKECAKSADAPSIAPIIAMHGTHERRPRELTNPIQLLDAAGLLIDAHNKTLVFEKDLEKVAISAIGGVPDDLAKAALENAKCAPVHGAFNVLMLHQSFSEFIPSGEEMLSLDDLPSGYDLHVCGHLHKRAFLKNNSIIIPGSTVVTQLREEEEEEKGFVLYDTKKREPKFVPIGSRKFHFLRVQVQNASAQQAKDAVEKALSLVDFSQNPIVRVIVKGTLAQGLSPQDVRLGSFGENVFVETSFSAEDLKEKLQSIRSKHEEKLSASQYGLKLLRARLKESGVEHLADEQTFLLLQENPEEFVRRCKKA